MKLRLAILPLLAILLLFGALAAACGSNDETDTGDSTPNATAVEPADDGDAGDNGDAGDDGGNGGGGSGTGSATLTIGAESWTFDNLFCAYSPDEAQNDNVSFFVSSLGESAEGVLIQLDATILDLQGDGKYEGDGVTYTVSVNDVEDFENPALAWSAITSFLGEDDPIILVDGKSVIAEAVFDDDRTDEIEEVAGSLEATCP